MGQMEKDFFKRLIDAGLSIRRNYSPRWLQSDLSTVPAVDRDWVFAVFDALGGDRLGLATKKGRPLPCDGFVIDWNCIIEFDELQHFTSYRKETLQMYGIQFIPTGFDLEQYIQWCDQHGEIALKKGASGYRKPVKEFPWQPGRAAQRALFDLLKDVLPIRYGLAPTIRFAEFEMLEFDTTKALVAEATRRMRVAL